MNLFGPVSSRKSIINVVAGSILLLGISLFFGLGINFLSSHPMPKFKQNIVHEINVDEAISLHDQGVLFVDARTEALYREGHVPGSYNLDFFKFDERFPDFSTRFDSETNFAIYCEGITGAEIGDTCETGEFLANRLKEMGYNRIMHFKQGYAFWIAAGAPIDSDLSVGRQDRSDSVSPFSHVRDIVMLVLGIGVMMLRRRRKAVVIAQLLLGTIFIISGSTKAFNPEALAVILHSYHILPDALTNLFALFLPWLELLAGLAMVSGLLPGSGALAIAALNLFFIPALTYRALLLSKSLGITFFAVNFDCGCGLGENYAWILVLRDLGFLLMGISVLISAQPFKLLKRF